MPLCRGYKICPCRRKNNIYTKYASLNPNARLTYLGSLIHCQSYNLLKWRRGRRKFATTVCTRDSYGSLIAALKFSET